MDADHFVVRYPKSYLWIGILCFVFCAGATVLMTLFPGDAREIVWIGWLVFGGFSLLSVWMIYASVKWNVRVSGETIRVTPEFGKPQEFTLGDITEVIIATSVRVVCNGKEIPLVDLYGVGSLMLIEKLMRNKALPYTARASRFIPWFMSFGCAFWLAMFVLAAVSQDTAPAWWVFLVCIAGAVSCVCTAVYSIVWRVEINDETVTVASLFRETKTVRLCDIDRVKSKQNAIEFYCDEKKLVAIPSVNAAWFVLGKKLQDEGIVPLE